MKNRDDIFLQTSATEIAALSQKIRAQIAVLDKKIIKHASDNESIAVWTQKINVLTAALSHLSGDDVDLDAVINNNPRHNNYYWLNGWYSGTSGNTIDLVNAVKSIKKPVANKLVIATMD